MPDKVRFFLWRLNRRIVAFTLCMLEEASLYAEYIGLDYSVALDLHPVPLRGTRYDRLGYRPRFQVFQSRCAELRPKAPDAASPGPARFICSTGVPSFLDPTRQYPILRKFPNYDELWGGLTNPASPIRPALAVERRLF